MWKPNWKKPYAENHFTISIYVTMFLKNKMMNNKKDNPLFLRETWH